MFQYYGRNVGINPGVIKEYVEENLIKEINNG